MNLAGKTALVTGGSRGIGKGVCLRLAEEGADVIVNYRSRQAAAQAVAEAIEAKGRRALAIGANVASRAEVAEMVSRSLDRFGRIDILVNNAGVQNNAPLLDLDDESWSRIMDINLKGIFLCSQIVGRHMREIGGGKIVNITSVCGKLPMAGFGHYCASKAGADMLTRVMAIEFAHHNICVNGVAPGTVETDMAIEEFERNPKEREAALGATPCGRLGQPKDIAGVVAFLCSPEADWVIGHILRVDGGYALMQ